MIKPIPAIDLIEGSCVRLSQGDFSKKTAYSSAPADLAREFEKMGYTRLHLVDLDGAFKGGAKAVSIGSMAVSDFGKVAKWIDKYGADKFIISADVRNGKVRTKGWTEDSGIGISDLLKRYWPLGVRRVLCTDISCDGMLCGPNIALYKDIMCEFPDCRLIASGGVGSIDDIAALNEAGIPAVVFGRAIYEGKIDLKQVAAEFGLNKQQKSC